MCMRQGSAISLRLVGVSLWERMEIQTASYPFLPSGKAWPSVQEPPGLTFQVLPSKAGSGTRIVAVARGSRCTLDILGCQKQTNKQYYLRCYRNSRELFDCGGISDDEASHVWHELLI